MKNKAKRKNQWVAKCKGKWEKGFKNIMAIFQKCEFQFLIDFRLPN